MSKNQLFHGRMVLNTHGAYDGPTEWTNPDWQTAEARIRSLNGKERDQVVLVMDDETSLLIGGGPDVFVCSVMTVKGEYQIANPRLSKDQVVKVMNGQLTEYVAAHTSDFENVLLAAKWFFLNGDIDPSLSWERV